MPMVATKAPYTLFVLEDDEPFNPREEFENLGKMLCWHRHYNLGDKHDFDDPRDFLQRTLFERSSFNPAAVYDYIKSGSAAEARLEYNRSAHEWELLENNYWSSGQDWYKSSS